MCADHLLAANQIDLSSEEHGALDDTDLVFIKELIHGEPLKDADGAKTKLKGRGPEKMFLYEIVSNARTGLDVDRLDYLQRDIQNALGVKHTNGEDLSLGSSVFTAPDTGHRVLAYPERISCKVMQTYTHRMHMYNDIYMDRKVLIMVRCPAQALVVPLPPHAMQNKKRRRERKKKRERKRRQALLVPLPALAHTLVTRGVSISFIGIRARV